MQIYDTTSGGTPVLLSTMKAPPNNANAAAFNVREVVIGAFEQEEPPVPTVNVMEASGDGRAIQLVAYSEYATVANGPLVQTPSASVDLLFVNGAIRTYMDIYATNDSADFALKNTGGRILTVHDEAGQALEMEVTDLSKLSLKFIHNSAFDSIPTYLYVQYYQADGTTLTGGAFTVPTISDIPDSLVSWLHIGPLTLEVQSANASLRPSANTGWAYYDINFTNSAANASGFERSRVYRFRLLASCVEGYQRQEFYWMNRHGGWQTLYIQGRMKHESRINRANYKRMRGNYGNASNTNDFTYNRNDRGRSSVLKSVETSYQVTTGLMTNTQSLQLQDLMQSRNVYVREVRIDNVTGQQAYVPVVIDTDSFNLLRQHDDTVQYSFRYSLANENTLAKR
jgi:hypothetical protein